MSRWRKVLFWSGLGLLAAPFLLWAGLRIGLATPLVNILLDRQLAPLLQARLRVGLLRTDLVSFIEAEDVLAISRQDGAALPLLTLRSVRAEFDLWSAWRGRLDWSESLSLMRVQGLNLFLLRDAKGSWNTQGLLKPRPPGPARAKAPSTLLLPPTRIVIEDSQVVIDDDARGFHSTVSHLQGGLDTRALPLLVFNLAGRTEGLERDNLSVAGQADLSEDSLFARVDMRGVRLESYLNYLLPRGELRFEGGTAGLSLRVQREAGTWDVGGRADIESGGLRIPAVSEPLSRLQGRVIFSPQGLRFSGTRCHFLGSEWVAEGELLDYRQPRLALRVSNPAFAVQELSRQLRPLQPLRLSGVAAVSVSVTGSVRAPVIEGEISAPALGVAGLVLDAALAHAHLDRDGLTITELRSGLWQGQISGGAALAFGKKGAASTLQARLRADGLSLQEARLEGQRLLPLSGTASAEISAEGPLDALKLDAGGRARQVRMGAVVLGDLDWSAKLRPGRLEGRAEGLQGQLAVTLGMDLGAAPRWKGTQADVEGMDVAAWALALASAPPCHLLPERLRPAAAWVRDHLAGRTDLRIGLSGPLRDPKVEAYVQSFKGELRALSGSFEMDSPKERLGLFVSGPLSLAEGELEAGQGKERLELRVLGRGRAIVLSALGHFPLPARHKARPGDLRLRVAADLRALEAFQLFRKSSGKLEAELRLADYIDAPKATGSLSVRGMDADLDRWLPELKGLRADIALNDHLLEVRDLQGRAGGNFQATGTLDFGGGRWPRGVLSVDTDEKGLRVDRWDPGRGHVVLQGVRLAFQGDSLPIQAKGRILVHDAYISYGGPSGAAAGEKQVDGPLAAQRWPGLSLDLRAAVGPNVWYEKSYDKGVDLSDPSRWLSSAASSAVESMLRPSLRVRLRPTEEDFMIQGQGSEVALRGELVVDRGEFVALGNEFSIRQDPSLAKVSFLGLRRGGNLQAHATSRARVTRNDPLTGKPVTTTYTIHIQVEPVPEEELEVSGLKDAFLNYRIIKFGSEPEIVANNPKRQEQAVLNLILLGDPLLDQEQQGGTGSTPTRPEAATSESSSLNQLGANQLSRLLQSEIKKQLAKIMKAGVRVFGGQFFDVFRVVPRLKQANRQGAASGAGKASASEASKQAQEQQLVVSDISVELGKTLFDKLYGSVQWVRFGEDSLANQTQTQAVAGRITRDQGVRLGLEYQIAPTRTLEAFYNYSVDDNLEPVSFAADKLSQAHSGILRIRNTLSSDNYSPATSRARRYDLGRQGARGALEAKEAK